MRVLAEATLALVLFADASRIDLGALGGAVGPEIPGGQARASTTPALQLSPPSGGVRLTAALWLRGEQRELEAEDFVGVCCPSEQRSRWLGARLR